MNYRLVFRHLGAVAFLVALGMLFCVPFGFGETPGERAGLTGLWISVGITLLIGGVLRWFGRRSTGELFQREAIAVVVLSWLLVIFLGTFPYLLRVSL